jgi:hypothetical protein
MAKLVEDVVDGWHSYKPDERRNIAFYVGGVLLYRFGLEVFNGAIITLAIDRFSALHTFEKLGALTGANQAVHYIGAVLIVRLR